MPTINGVIDLRSDTLTQPSKEMLQAMITAPIGDDVWNEDPTVHKLERLVASIAGKEAGLFVPSGVMSNLIASITHCQINRNLGPSEIIVGDASHIGNFEAGNVSNIGHIYARQLPNEADGTISLARIEATIKSSRTQDVHFPVTKAICLENTHNMRGGCVLSVEYCWAVRRLCDSLSNGTIGVHLDGARVWNAAIELGKPVAELCAPFHTVSLCVSKGLGAPVGSVLVGSKEFIAIAKKFRKSLGGGLRQSGVLAGAAIYAVENNFKKLADDHKMAKKLGKALAERGGFEVLPVHTNLVIWKCPIPGQSARFCQICAQKFNVKLSGMGADLCRAVPHIGNNHEEDFEKIVQACIETKKIFLATSKL